MTTAAIFMMLITMTIVTSVTIYFFIKVLKTPPKDPESYKADDHSES